MCKKHQCNVRGHTGTRSQIYNEIADGKVQNSRFLFDLTWNAPVAAEGILGWGGTPDPSRRVSIEASKSAASKGHNIQNLSIQRSKRPNNIQNRPLRDDSEHPRAKHPKLQHPGPQHPKSYHPNWQQPRTRNCSIQE